jgi:acetyl esterase/lipase
MRRKNYKAFYVKKIESVLQKVYLYGTIIHIKGERKMNRASVFFKASDLFMHYPRNFEKFPDVTVMKDISYDDRFGYTKGDAFYKEGGASYPVLVNVHGGGFVRGDKRHRAAWCCKFARQGYFVWNVNYRLAPAFKFPAACEDVINALNFLPHLQRQFKLDLSKIIITGDSAGAFYAMSAIIAQTNESFRQGLNLPRLDVSISGFMGFCGAYSLEVIVAKKTPFGIAKEVGSALFGYKVKSDFSNLKDFVLFEYTNLLDFVNEKFPPSFIMASKVDAFVGGQGELLEEKLKNLNIDYTAYYAAEKGDAHCFQLLPKHKNTSKVMENAYLWLKNR